MCSVCHRCPPFPRPRLQATCSGRPEGTHDNFNARKRRRCSVSEGRQSWRSASACQSTCFVTYWLTVEETVHSVGEHLRRRIVEGDGGVLMTGLAGAGADRARRTGDLPPLASDSLGCESQGRVAPRGGDSCPLPATKTARLILPSIQWCGHTSRNAAATTTIAIACSRR